MICYDMIYSAHCPPAAARKPPSVQLRFFRRPRRGIRKGGSEHEITSKSLWSLSSHFPLQGTVIFVTWDRSHPGETGRKASSAQTGLSLTSADARAHALTTESPDRRSPPCIRRGLNTWRGVLGHLNFGQLVPNMGQHSTTATFET